MAKKYDNNSISSLKDEDRVRLRPGVIFGSDSIEGCQHSFFEILSNSIDEAKEGHGDTINIIRHKDQSITIEDFGRGIPVDYNEKEKRYNWELIYCELYAGGKFNNASDENYVFSLGLNGLGACATQYSSEFFNSEIYRDGYKYTLHFEKGKNIGGLKKTKTKIKKTGTKQHWKPDKDVFTDIDIPIEYFENILKQQAVVNMGIKFIFKDEEINETKTFFYPEGIVGYINEMNIKGITNPYVFSCEGKGQDTENKKPYFIKYSLAFCFNNSVNEIDYFHNSSFLEHGGSPDKAIKNAFVFAFDKEIKSQNKYNKTEGKISFQDIQDSLILISNSFSTQTSYENQTKKAINNKFIQDFMTQTIKDNLEIWFIEKKSDANKVLSQILINKRSRESAEKQRLIVRKKLTGTNDINNRVEKFVDCRSKDPNKRELYIVEGNSALGSVKLGRDAEFQSIMPLRGKILNCLKSDYKRIFASDIITDLIKVLGCGVEMQNKNIQGLEKFDINKLKFNKVIICTDADVDGFQIRTLILVMIYRLVPTLINNGYMYIAKTPLYEISYKNKTKVETFFAYDENEKNKYIKGKDEKNIKIQRSKGLGENTPEMMSLTTLSPKTRHLVKITPEDIKVMDKYFELFLGNNITNRKEHIEKNGHLYLDDLDIS